MKAAMPSWSSGSAVTLGNSRFSSTDMSATDLSMPSHSSRLATATDTGAVLAAMSAARASAAGSTSRLATPS